MAHGSLTEKEMAELIQRSAESNAALMRGDIDRYRALITLTEDLALIVPTNKDQACSLEHLNRLAPKRA